MRPTPADHLPDGPGCHRRWGAGALLGAALLVYLAHNVLYWEQINDDAFITFRYSRFLAEGRGPYYNPGEHVEGYTNFLLMLLMAGVIAAFGPDEVLFAAKLLGVTSGAAALLGAWALSRGWIRRLEGLHDHAGVLAGGAALLVGVSGPFVLNSTTGLETSLFSALCVTGLWLAQAARERDRWLGSGAAYALGALTRPEGAVLFGAAWVGEWVRDGKGHRGRKRLIIDASLVSLAVGGQLVCRYLAYDGQWLPNTYYAKTADSADPFPGRGQLMGFATTHPGLLLTLAALTGAWAAPGLRRCLAPALLMLLAGTYAVIRYTPDWMPGYRLIAPYVPVLAALATTGACAAGARLRLRPRATGVILALLGVAAAAWEVRPCLAYAYHVNTRAGGYLEGHLALTRWLAERARPGDTIALMDIGLVGYHCIDQRILDITGLTDRYIARSPGPFLKKEFDPSYVLEPRPRFIVLVATAPRTPTGPDLSKVSCWTSIEDRIIGHPIFRAGYFRPRPVRGDAPLLERLAELLGAQRVFEHDYPFPQHYWLAVYERADDQGPATSPDRSGP